MKKSIVFIGFVLIVFLSIVTSVFAKDVAYIVVNNRTDSSFTQALNELGLTYDIVNDNSLGTVDLNSYGMLLIGDQVFTRLNAQVINSHNSLFVNPMYVDDFGFSSRSATQIGGSQPLKIKNIKPEHVINTGMPIDIQVYTTCCEGSESLSIHALRRIYTLVRLVKIDSTMNDPGDSVIAAALPGTLLLNGKTTEGRNVFFGITDSRYWTTNAKNLFKNSILWTLNGEDLDNDGFFSDEDCNDTNPQINPDGIEIPYDNIDQDCSGSDLNDLDEDDFVSSIVGGNDCDDSNSNINPDAREIIDNIDQNCRNDAPILRSNFPNSININEDGQLNNFFDLDTYFADYENDALSFGVINNTNISILINDDNKVTIKPNLNFFGNNTIKFTATDTHEAVSSSNGITINVNAVNDRPTIQDIDTLYVVATNALILQPVVNDVDNDPLTITYGEPFNENGVWIPRLNEIGTRTSFVRVSDGRLSESDTFNIIIEPKVVFNEIEFNPEGTDVNNEWIELFNPNNQSANITDWYIKDNSDNIIEIGVDSIGRNEFYIISVNSGLDDEGEILKLYNSRNELIDEVNQLSDQQDSIFTWSRKPNGIDNNVNQDWNLQKNTKGFDNDADLIPPVVTLLIPADNSFSDINALSFKYLATDNSAQSFTCYFYSNLNSTNGTMERLAELSTRNNIERSFSVTNIPDGVFKWNVLCKDQYTESFAPLDFTFRVDMNYPPVIEDIQEINVNEAELIRIEVITSDRDNDEIQLSIDDTRFSKEGNIFTYLTDYEDAGMFFVNISASDGNLTTVKSIKVTVNNLNRAPVFTGTISDWNMNEDTSANIELNNYFDDPDNDELLYSTDGNENLYIDENDILRTREDYYGTERIKIKAVDNNGGEVTSNEFIVVVNPVNDAPRVRGFNPSNTNPAISETDQLQFSIDAFDIDSEQTSVKWFVDGVEKNSGSNFVFNGEGVIKNYEIKADISDGELTTSKIWNLIISDHPVTNYFDGETTNLDLEEEQLKNIQNVVLEKKGVGRINIFGPIDLSDIVDLDNNVIMMPYLVGINSGKYSEFVNQKSTITLYGLLFNGIPTIFYNSGFTKNYDDLNQECPTSICSNIKYNPDSRMLSFDVNGFSTFKIGNPTPRTCSQLGGDICTINEICNGNIFGASDSSNCCSIQCTAQNNDNSGDGEFDSCVNGNVGKLKIDISDPGDNDEFRLGDKVNVNLEIKNNNDVDKDIRVQVKLYDKDNGKELDDDDERQKINKRDKEEFTFELDIPDEADDVEGDKLILSVKAFDQDNEGLECQQEDINLDIELLDNDLRIEDAEFYPNVISCDMNTKLDINIVNYGKDDQSAILKIQNEQLKFEKVSEAFEVEAFDSDDNSENIQVPINLGKINNGVYDFIVTLDYNSESDSVSVPINVDDCINNNKIETKSTKKTSNSIVSVGKNTKKSTISVKANTNSNTISNPQRTVQKEEIDQIVFFEPLPEQSVPVIFLAALNILMLIGIAFLMKMHVLKR
ncbi:lamin tail domain-containing protein [Candidatus Woesearchaeota archaeon]|nr:lamin tail domain-containing protein [Candidatus Woesearchaeota archaeon]